MLKIKHTICPTCSVGCGLNIISKNKKIVGINSYKDHSINEGRNCNNCTDNINLFINNKIKQSTDYTSLIDDVTKILKDNKDVTILTSGKTDNVDLDRLMEFTKKHDYTLLAYENNFNKTDANIIASYDDISNANYIITIGDIYRENALIGRRIIHAKKNNCYTININKTKNLTGYNSDKFIKINSYDEIPSILEHEKIDENAILIINKIDSTDNYNKIIEYVENNKLKILPLPKYPNSYSVLHHVKSTSINEIISKINDSDVIIFTDINLTNFMKNDIFNNKIIISFDTLNTTNESSFQIPVRAWYEKNGSFTNSMGITQRFNNTICDNDNQLKTIAQVIDEIDGKL